MSSTAIGGGGGGGASATGGAVQVDAAFKNDNHTISINCADLRTTREDIHRALTEACTAYSKTAGAGETVQDFSVILGGLQRSRSNVYIFGFVKDVRLFNLLVGKTLQGEDRFVYDYGDRNCTKSGASVDVSIDTTSTRLPDKLDDLNLTIKDLVDQTPRAQMMLQAVRALDYSSRSDIDRVKRYLDPLILVEARDTRIKIVPACFSKDYRNKVQPNVLTLPKNKNGVSKLELDAILNTVCIRDWNVSFFIKGGTYQGRSPLVCDERYSLDIHFANDMLAKMCYFMLNGFPYSSSGICQQGLHCEFKPINAHPFVQGYSRDGPRRDRDTRGETRGNSGVDSRRQDMQPWADTQRSRSRKLNNYCKGTDTDQVSDRMPYSDRPVQGKNDRWRIKKTNRGRQ